MGKVTDEIFNTIEILIDRKIKSLSFDRTVDGKIIKKTTTGYLVCVEGDNINIPVLGNGAFHANDIVKIHIPQSNIKNAYIIGTGINNEKQVNEVENNLNQIQNYTSEEKQIGKWNGKNLYRQSITVDTPVSIAATTWYTIKTMMPNLNIVSLQGSFHDADNIHPFCYGSYHLNYVKASGILRFYNASSRAYRITGFRVIVEYTY